MVILDVAIVNVALPSIKSDLHFSATSLQWVISAYAILFGGTLLLGGRLADLLGLRRLRPEAARLRTHARDEGRLGLGHDDRAAPRRDGARARLRRDRAPLAVAAPPASHLPAADAVGGERDDGDPGLGHVLRV